jgi:SAM-dependent methyltransferase
VGSLLAEGLADTARGELVTDEADWAPPGVDARRANVARVYDYWLGGSHNFSADRDLARQIAAVEPGIVAMARANRAFLASAVRRLAAAGIDQFLDIGSGIPTQGNVHEVAGPGARVAYVDTDPVAIAHSRAILAGRRNAAVIGADLRDPDAILRHPDTRRLIDFSRPVGLLLVAVLHFIADDERPRDLVAGLRDVLAPGSFLVVSHATSEGQPELALAMAKVYSRSVTTSAHVRSRLEIERFFDGFKVLEPGVVPLARWRSGPGAAPADPDRLWGLRVGIGQKG